MKKIKFNLHTNGIGVANLEDLREHFNIDDILNHYKSGLLQKWLEVQGLQEELEKLNKLSIEDNELISKLLNIFEIKYSKEDIKEIELSRSYLENKQKFLENFKKNQNNFNQCLEDYFSDFRSTLYQIIENPRDKAIIKVNLKRLEDDFWPLTLMNFEEIFDSVFDDSPLAILLSLSFKKFRTYICGKPIFEAIYGGFENVHIFKHAECDDAEETKDIIKYFSTIDIKQIDYLTLYDLEERMENIEETINGHNWLNNKDIQQDDKNYGLSKFLGDTNGYWKDLVPKTKKVLVLNISQGSLICAPTANDEIPKELSAEEVNGNFLILNGLQFKSNNQNYSVTYLEI